MTKRALLKLLRIVAGIAAVVFFLMPITTFSQVLLCVGSLMIALICSAVLVSLEGKNTGYWPDKPKQ